MSYCPIAKNSCQRDNCMFSIEDECSIAAAITSIQDLSATLEVINAKLPNMDSREEFDLFVSARVVGAVDTYEQN